MSGIAVVFNLDARPASAAQLEPMLSAMAYRGPDGLTSHLAGPVALGHAMLRVTPESLNEKQPLVDAPSGMCLVFNGRLDNRDDLYKLAEDHGLASESNTDPELVLRAYQALGADFAAKLVGDFALVIWDPNQRRLLCARDQAGMIPLYYYSDGKTLLVASELQQILSNPSVPQEPNEGIIGEYMCGKLLTRDETLFRGVMRLPPSHMMIATESGLKISRYYDLDPSKSIRYRTDDEYAQHFLEVFTEAVRCRMRCRTGVAAELSGGLDSSSIVSLVESKRRAGEWDVPEFESFSLIYDEPTSDERSYVAAVAAKWNGKINLLPHSQMDLAACIEGVRRSREWAESPNGGVYCSLRQAVVDKGFKVIVTGMGGDQWLTGSDYCYAELISDLRFRELIRLLKTDRSFGIPGTRGHSRLKNLAWWGLRPLLPDNVRIALSNMVPRERFPALVSKDLAKRINLMDRLRAYPKTPKGTTFSQRTIYHEFNDGWMVAVMELKDRDSAPIGIEQRHPFYDRRLVEFCLAIPESQRAQNNTIKYVMRNAMDGILPEAIRTRSTKAEFSAMTTRLFKRVGGAAFFDHLAIADLGWVDGAAARRMAREGLTNYQGGNLWPLVNAFQIEVWYNVVFRDGGDLMARVEGHQSKRANNRTTTQQSD